MYCPRCGQQQVSDDMKFCSRCGLPIAGLSSWVASAGGLHEETRLVSASPRRKGITRGAKLMFLSAVLVPFCLFLSFLFDEPGPLLFPVTIFLIGLSLMLYSRLFGQEVRSIKGYEVQGSRLGTTLGNALPEAPNPMTNRVNTQKVRTSELVRPPSVTEHTTKLLDNE
jgi:hypothetical protein